MNRMLCLFRKLTLCFITAICVANVGAFSLLGPFESWQTGAIGYNPRGGEIGAPHALGDEFRWIDGQITYGFDSSFVNYFGTEGIKQVNAAMQVVNNLPALSTITTNDLLNTVKYPLVAWRYNGTAQALNLRDLKSTALAYVLEGLGLGQPEHYAWTLRSRSTATPDLTNYLVFNRNFDPITFKPTSYVNGERYSYRVREFRNPDFADAVEFIVDKAKPSFSSVAGGTFGNVLGSSSLLLGSYYINLTRDDVGGLRYLYQRFNQNVEGQSSGGATFLQVTNYDSAMVQTNFDLALFSIRSLTNNAAQLAGLYPGLVITQTLSTVKPVQVIGSIDYTNGTVPWSPDAANLSLLLKTNWLQTNVVIYNHKFANIFTNTATPEATTIETYDVVRTKDPLSSVQNPVWTTNQVNASGRAFKFLGTNIPSGSFNLVNRWLATGSPDVSRFVIDRTEPVLETITKTTNILFLLTTPLLVTNYDAATTQTTYDLALFSTRSLTNSAEALIAQYPGLVITQTLTSVKPVSIIGSIELKNGSVPWSPDGANLTQLLKTNWLQTNVLVYNHKVANIYTNASSSGPVSIQSYDIVRTKDPLSSVQNPVWITNKVDLPARQLKFLGTNIPAGSFNIVTRWLADGAPDFHRLAAGYTNELDILTTNVLDILTTNVLYSATTLLQVTNYDNVAVQTNHDLTLFGMRSMSNNALALTALYPGLVVTQTLSTVTPIVVIDRIYPDPTQIAWSAAGIFQPTVLKTNYVSVNVPVYFHKYANVYTNLTSRSATVNYRDVSRVKAPFSSGSNPTYVTNVVDNLVSTNLASGSVNFVTRWLADGSPDFSRYTNRTENSSYHFIADTGSTTDIVDLPKLKENLKLAATNTPAAHVKARLSAASVAALNDNLPTLSANLVGDLNKLIDTTVFNAELVAGLDLRPETYLLYIQGPTGADLRRLNRMLLEDAFPGQLLRLLASVPLVQRVTYTTNVLYAAVNLVQGTTFRREQVITFTNIEYAGFPITLFNGESVQREEVIAYQDIQYAGYPITLFNGESVQREEVMTFTNTEYAGFPITSVAIANGLRGGVDKLLLTNIVYNDLNPGTFRFTNSYPIYTVTNGVQTVQTIERIQTQPDILFSAADLGTDADGFTPITVRRGSRWIDGTAANTSDPNKEAGTGPGEIGSGLVISFSKILPVHLNIFPGDITENTGANGSGFGSVVGVWGSYDGSTNAPTIYPKDITLELLEKKLFR